jgi:hypothetical protein
MTRSGLLSKCLVWFDKEELRLAKDDKTRTLNWVDVDRRDKLKFKVEQHCPAVWD